MDHLECAYNDYYLWVWLVLHTHYYDLVGQIKMLFYISFETYCNFCNSIIEMFLNRCDDKAYARNIISSNIIPKMLFLNNKKRLTKEELMSVGRLQITDGIR